MTAPRIEIDLGKLKYNASALVGWLGERGISVTGVTKASLGSPDIARVMLGAGIQSIGDSRLANIARMRRERIDASFALTRSPMLSEVGEVVRCADISFNTELEVISALAASARVAERRHGVVLMVEMGDLREGLMPADLSRAARAVIGSPNLYLQGIGCNLACYGGVIPDAEKMAELSELAESLEQELGLKLNMVSGGNSANLDWAFGATDHGRINNLRLGESILLGRETLNRQAIEGLHTDAFSVVAEIIESKIKPSQPSGRIAQSAFGVLPEARAPGEARRCILALGRQDCDPDGLTPPSGIEILGASSDHLIIESQGEALEVGCEIAFQPDYSALLRAMTSAYVTRVLLPG